MTPPEALQARINLLISEHLQKFHCSSGSLQYRPSSVSLKGIKANGQSLLIWELPRQLNILLSQWMENQEEGAGLTITISLPDDSFEYTVVSAASLQRAADAAKQEQEDANRQYKIDLKHTLSQQTTPFGSVLAGKVADALERGESFLAMHPGYCGMGFDFREGVYYYGEVWEGWLHDKATRFDDRAAFADWLAQQSDASLARLEAADPFYWGNQTITRERLETFTDRPTL